MTCVRAVSESIEKPAFELTGEPGTTATFSPPIAITSDITSHLVKAIKVTRQDPLAHRRGRPLGSLRARAERVGSPRLAPDGGRADDDRGLLDRRGIGRDRLDWWELWLYGTHESVIETTKQMETKHTYP